MRARERPSNAQRPLPARSKPVITLNRVVLPAPLGPMRAVISPRWTSRWSTSTAARPPTVRLTWSTRSTESGLAAPGWASTPARAGLTLIEELLLPAPQDALGAERHQQNEPQPHQRELHGAHVGGLEEGDVAVVDGLYEQAVHALDQEPEDEGHEDRHQHPGLAPRDHHDVGEEGQHRDVGVGSDGLGGHRQTHPTQGTDDAADHQALELVAEHVLPQAAGRVLVFSDR